MAPEPVSGLERMIERAVERALIRVLDSGTVNRVWDHVLASDEVQRLVERIAEAPEVRSAITSQGVGLMEDVGREVRRVAVRLDGVVERVFRRIFFRRQRPQPSDHAGLVTRALALVVDVALLNAAFFVVSGIIAFALSVIVPDSDVAQGALLAAGASAWIVIGSLYLVTFWTLAGQTPGMRFLGLRLQTEDPRGITPRRAFRRLIGLFLAVIPFGLGFLPVLTSERRRGLDDIVGGTDVMYVADPPRVAPWSSEATSA